MRYRIALNRPGLKEYHLLTLIKRWNDGTVKDYNLSFVSDSPLSWMRLPTAQKHCDALNAYVEENTLDGKPKHPGFVVLVKDDSMPAGWRPVRSDDAKADGVDWRHECGYTLPKRCENCRHCVIQCGNGPLARAYCMEGYKGRHDDIYRPNGSEDSRRFWEYAEGRQVEMNAKCRKFFPKP